MYLGKQQVDGVEFSFVGSPQHQQQYIQDVIQSLVKKHRKLLASEAPSPTFFLEGVPSYINHFHSLLQ
jgi:hypothetical protein